MLQWGRDLTVADSRINRYASMGPDLTVADRERVNLLQWGRDLTVADSADTSHMVVDGL